MFEALQFAGLLFELVPVGVFPDLDTFRLPKT